MLPIHTLRTKIQDTSPLIHNITNVVVTNFTANGLYAIGASPVMAYAKEEVENMAKVAQALVLNIGTLTKQEVEAMLLAGKAANLASTPIVLDPVGVGATPFRTESAKKLLTELNIAVIRGNGGEIANLIDHSVEMRGVDSTAKMNDTVAIAKEVAKTWGTIVALTGESDVITDGDRVYTVDNGHFLQSKITGAGCLLSSVVGAFISVHDDLLEAVTCAVAFYGISAQVAAEKEPNMGPGHFQVHFIDALYQLTSGQIDHWANFNKSIMEGK
ncbi:hydroxyethylthiazole kinase [Salipaludibacillus sp. HK11]|uniref:hydroxyethylthiazole kinase n=1 Tax=Salipaludibacillus sp. HK11 TaxID=3394320 RepID=UPI0039FBF795